MSNHIVNIPRRHLLLALGAAAIVPRALAQPARPTIATRRLNNFMIAVSDLNRSVAFYESLFGASLRQGNVALFRLEPGPHFFCLVQVQAGAKPGFLSYGLTVADFDTGRLTQTLRQHGVSSVDVIPREGTPEVFIADPDGIRIQLQHESYGRGSGPLGAILPAAARSTQPAPFALKSLSHLTLTTADRARSEQFHRGVFGLSVPPKQGPVPILTTG